MKFQSHAWANRELMHGKKRNYRVSACVHLCVDTYNTPVLPSSSIIRERHYNYSSLPFYLFFLLLLFSSLSLFFSFFPPFFFFFVHFTSAVAQQRGVLQWKFIKRDRDISEHLSSGSIINRPRGVFVKNPSSTRVQPSLFSLTREIFFIFLFSSWWSLYFSFCVNNFDKLPFLILLRLCSILKVAT